MKGEKNVSIIIPEETALPESGMWAPYEPVEIGEPLELLEQAGTFVLLVARVRKGVETQYGLRDAVDLEIATTETGTVRKVSGFAAGIVGQVGRMADGDLPVVARISGQATPRGTTKVLMLVQKLEPGADVAVIARSLPTPIQPVNLAANGNGQPAGNDGIPFG